MGFITSNCFVKVRYKLLCQIKKCPKCLKTRVKKNGKRSGIQTYKCLICGCKFQNKRRKSNLEKDFLSQYIWQRQTYSDLAKKYNENLLVLNAIAAHHGDVEPTSPIAVLVQTANEMSISRPGARREAIENFVKRLQDMEDIAISFDGVEKAYAIQAGKEIRVIVSHEKVEDTKLAQLAQDIAVKIESETEYPGQIKVVVIREFRGIEYA